MKRKAKTWALVICLTVCLILCSALGSAFMKAPEVSEEYGIETLAATEDVTETITASSFSEGVTYESAEGVYYQYVAANGGFSVTGHTDTCTEAYISDTLTVSVSGTNHTYPVVRIEDKAFRSDYDITYIRIGRYVEYVGEGAFYYCRNCTVLDYFAENAVSGGVTKSDASVCAFGYVGYWVDECNIFVGETVETVAECMFAFCFCSSLTFAEGSRLTEIGTRAFYNMLYANKTVIPEIRIPDTVETVGDSAFDNTFAEVEALYIPESLIKAGSAAFALRNVDAVYYNAVDFPDCDSSSDIFDSLSYSQSKNGATVYIGKNVTRIPSYLFYSKYGVYIKEVMIEGIDDGGYALESIGTYAFWKCTKLDSVTLPMGVEAIEPHAFDGCTSLASVTLGDTDGWYVTDGDGNRLDDHTQDLFSQNYMSDSSTVATYVRATYVDCYFHYTDGFTYVLSDDGTYYSVTGYVGNGGDVSIPDTHRAKPVREIGAEAFKNEMAITSVIIPESVTMIGSSAFYGCTKLASVTIRGSVLETVGSDAFYNCSALKSLYVSSTSAFVSVNYEGRYANPLALVSSNNGTFYVGGSSYTSLKINGTERIGTYAFAYCTVISDIVIEESVKTIDSYAFYGNTAIKSVTIPESVKCIGENAFSSSGVTEVVFAVTGGWKIYDQTGSLFAELSASEVASNAAGLLTGTYANYVWKNEKTNFLAPVLTGVSVDPDGFYTNGDISVYVSVAAGAYVSAVYWKAPGEGGFSSFAGDTLTLYTDELVCGTYVFFAEDSDGNVSDYYYAVYDDVAPEIYAAGATIFDGYVGDGFTVYASDNFYGVTLWYSYQGESFSSAGGNSYSVLSSSGDGRYSFYAEDRAGNRCGEYTLILDTVQPYGRWETQDYGSYALSFVWDDESWRCDVNGSEYLSGSPITDEGSYTATLTTLSGISKSFMTDLGHNFIVGSVVSGNCEEGGTVLYVCTYCDASYEAETAATGSHRYVLEIVEPTCETEGYSVSVCEVCGEYDWSTYQYLSELGHNVYETEKAATCEEEGFRGGVCLRCGKEFEGETIAATGHLWYVITYDAGCETEGYRETVCLRCSEISSYVTLDPVGHDYREVSRTEATCEVSSLVTYRCSRCSFSYEAYDGGTAEHDYSVVSVVRESACGVEGERWLTCSVCGDYIIEAIPALSHNNVETGRYKDSETGETIVTYSCSICGESFTVSIGNQEEAAASGITGMMETYMRYMWWILLATVAVWSVAMGVRYAMARNSDDKAKAKSMIINYVIGIVVIAIILVACPYLVYAIALLAG